MSETNDQEKDLRERVLSLERFRNLVLICCMLLTGILGFLGVGAWQILSSKFEYLRTNADKLDDSQQRISGQLTDITTKTSTRYGEMLTRLDDLRAVSSKAKSDAEHASNTAGNLRDAINRSISAAESAEQAAKQTTELAEQARDASAKATAAMIGMQDTQKSLEVFLSKLTPAKVEKNTFTVLIKGSFGNFYFAPGDSLPYDRVFSSNSSTATIWVPDGSYATVKVSGNSNDLHVHSNLQGRVSIETTGSFNRQSFFK